MDEFDERNRRYIAAMGDDETLRAYTRAWFEAASRHEYSYHFTWLGQPIIQFPQDIVAIQEIVWMVKPRVIIETGIARGGSLLFHASMLELIGGPGVAIGIEIDIRPHNRKALEAHPMAHRIRLVEGSSIDPAVVERVVRLAGNGSPVLVVLDSDHTHGHVLQELRLYAPLVTKGSYLIVLDTVIEEMTEGFSAARPWGRGDNPATAVREFLRTTDRFVVDRAIDHKLLITVGPGGYLKCVKDP